MQRGKNVAIAKEGNLRSPDTKLVPFHFNYDAHAKFEAGLEKPRFFLKKKLLPSCITAWNASAD